MVSLYDCKTNTALERKLEGKQWGDLTEEEQENLIHVANVDNDNLDKRTGECIIDFESLSISGKIDLNSEDIEYVIDDDAILYDSNR